jgi:transcriptional regulator with XRE-family HTH domain
MTQFGDRLFLLRRKRRLLQKQVALEAGIDPSYLGGLERGRRDAPAVAVFDRLTRALAATDEEREWLRHALAVARLERLVSDGPYAIAGADLLVRIAEQLPSLNSRQLQLLEAFVEMLAAARSGKEDAMA